MGLRRFFKTIFICAPLGMAGCVEMPAASTGGAAAESAPVVSSAPDAGATPAQSGPAAGAPGPVNVPPISDTSAPDVESAEANALARNGAPAWQPSVDVLCEQIGDKLSSVSIEDCTEQQFVFGGGFSVNQRPLIFREHQPAKEHTDFRVLIMGGIHGDEYSSISILFKWLALFSPESVEGTFHWRFAPLVNPDGLLDGNQAKRQNANGVDLNRNFPSRDWNATAAQYWQESTGSNPRRFPGESPASEPEVKWVVQQIEEFQPDVIVSVHAPYHLLDFDGPAEAPANIGELYLHQLGVYPGSLGNFAGLNRQIPVVTLELPSAGIMPPAEQIELMWNDLVAWLDREGRKGLRRL